MGMRYASWNMLCESCANLHAKQWLILYLATFLLSLAFGLNLFCNFEVLGRVRSATQTKQMLLRELTFEGENLLLARIRGPYLLKRNGIGNINKAIPPMRVDAQLTPIPSYICLVNRGNAAPTAERTIVLAANADAEYIR